MMTTDISYIGMAVGMALLAVPVWIFYKLGLARQIGSTLTAVARMVLQLFLTGLYFVNFLSGTVRGLMSFGYC